MDGGNMHGGDDTYDPGTPTTPKTPKTPRSAGTPTSRQTSKRFGRADLLQQVLKAQDGRERSPAEIEQLKRAEVTDCALTFSQLAFAETMPTALAKLSPDVKPLRVWATMLALCVLERMKESWLWGDGEACPAIERTIVDAAREWLEGHAVEHAELAHELDGKSGKALFKEARAITLAWQRTWMHRVKLLRREEAMRSSMSVDHAERAGRSIVLAVQLKHDTMASFLAPAARWRRWQGFMIVVTLVICALCMNIWMVRPPPVTFRRPSIAASFRLPSRHASQFQLKSSNCCSALRLILDSGPDGGACPPAGLCRGFAGNCADIAAQFADLPVLPDYPDGLADFACHAFPDDARFGDTILVGLRASPPHARFLLFSHSLLPSFVRGRAARDAVHFHLL